jgi:uncharacterized protein (TIGR02145 family)
MTMKKYFGLILICFSFISYAQPPASIPYQAVLRDGNGTILTSQEITVRFTIHDGSANGNAEWEEVQIATTSAQGLVSLSLGSEATLDNINWSGGSKFLQVETNLGNGFIDLGTQPLLSVPYALYASNGLERVSSTGDTLFLANGNNLIIPGISEANAAGPGCVFTAACNYNSEATSNDGSCHFPGDACNDGNAATIGDQWTADCTCEGSVAVTGSNSTCGASNVHNPELTYGTLTDQQGNVYRTIQIGVQEWMAENLKTTIYANGDPIPGNLSYEEWTVTNSGAWAYPGGGSSTLCPYGRLYNWYTVDDERGLCPTGWHVPSLSEFTMLAQYVGQGDGSINGDLRSAGSQYWAGSGPEDDNSTGFSALPAGARFYNEGLYPGFGVLAYFWTTSVFTSAPNNSFFQSLYYINCCLDGGNTSNQAGFSVRCLRD